MTNKRKANLHISDGKLLAQIEYRVSRASYGNKKGTLDCNVDSDCGKRGNKVPVSESGGEMNAILKDCDGWHGSGPKA